MTLQISIASADAMLDAFVAAQGEGIRLQVWSGAPVEPTLDPSGVKLVDMALPTVWISPASGGIASKAGTWQGVGITDGAAGSFRFITASGVGFATGSLGVAGSGADAIIDDTAIVSGQTVAVTAFAFTFPGFGA